MKEEEKQAIKDSEDIIKTLNKHKDKDFIGRLYYKNKSTEDILQILLNLIEKQKMLIQRKMEEYEKEIKFLKSQIPQKTMYYYKDYISKDKIKELIEEKTMTDTYNFKTIAVKDIEELLGE